MSFAGLAQKSLDIQFTRLGEAATWRKADSTETDILFVPFADDAILDGFQKMPLKTEQVIADVRVTQAPDISVGDSIIWNSVTYRVKDAPRHKDRLRLIWRLGLVKEA